MIQRYFAGELRPDQKKSWKAEDGIFVLYADHLATIEQAVKEKMAQKYIAEICNDRKFKKPQEVALYADHLAALGQAVREKDEKIDDLELKLQSANMDFDLQYGA